LAIALHTCLWRQARHVGGCHELLEKITQCFGLGVDIDLVFPFEFGPHCSELCFSAVSGFDIVHDVYMYVVKDNDVGVDSLFAEWLLASAWDIE
jgi:hypothetical protein